MSYTYAGTAVYPASLTLPQDGDAPSAASVTVAFEGLADRTAYLYAGPYGHAGWQHVALSAGFQPGDGTTDRFRAEVVAGAPVLRQFDITSAGNVWLPLVLPPSGIVTDIEAYLQGAHDAGGVHAGLPATMPALYLYSQTGGVLTLEDSIVDGSADVATYEAFHAIGLSGLTIASAEGTSWWVMFRGEAGVNAAAEYLSLFDINYAVDNTP